MHHSPYYTLYTQFMCIYLYTLPLHPPPPFTPPTTPLPPALCTWIHLNRTFKQFGFLTQNLLQLSLSKTFEFYAGEKLETLRCAGSRKSEQTSQYDVSLPREGVSVNYGDYILSNTSLELPGNYNQLNLEFWNQAKTIFLVLPGSPQKLNKY